MTENPITDLIAPVLGFLGVVTTSIATLFVKHWLDRKDAETVVEKDDLRFTLADVNALHDNIARLQMLTAVDRFLILKAENGLTTPRHATVLYEQHRQLPPLAASFSYARIVVDDAYREMLKTAAARGVTEMETASMPDCRLRGFYEAEKVTFSNCYFLARVTREEESIIFYSTFATHQAEGFTKADKLKILVVAERLREMFESKIKEAKTQ